jgi:hypothetical protein
MAETAAPENIRMSTPQVSASGHALTVTGAVTRTDSAGDAVSGFADIQVLNANGEIVDELLGTLKPGQLAPGQTATYRVSFWHPKPRDARLKIVFVDQRDAQRFYAGDAWGAAGGAPGTGGSTAGTAPRAASAHTSGNWSRPSGSPGAGVGVWGSGVGGLSGPGSNFGRGVR